jgi:hypothetical protein
MVRELVGDCHFHKIKAHLSKLFGSPMLEDDVTCEEVLLTFETMGRVLTLKSMLSGFYSSEVKS